MKAIVAEIDKKQMIVITDKGDFIKVRRQMSAGIGDEIEIKPQKAYLKYKILARVAACFLACIFLTTGVYAYYTPYSYVSVDINPSIALSLNRFERVISVSPISEDAESFIKETKNLKNQDIDKALTEIIKSATEQGYIDEQQENQVMVVVTTEDPKQVKRLEDKVAKTAAKELSKVGENSAVTVEKTSVKSYKEAIAQKVSPGKEILADKVREVNPQIKAEEIEKMSVKDAVHLIKDGRKAAKEAEKEAKKAEKEEKKKAKESDKDNNKKEQALTEKNNKGEKDREASKAASESKENKKDKKDKYDNKQGTAKNRDEEIKDKADDKDDDDRNDDDKNNKKDLKKKDKEKKDNDKIKEKDKNDKKDNENSKSKDKPKGGNNKKDK